MVTMTLIQDVLPEIPENIPAEPVQVRSPLPVINPILPKDADADAREAIANGKSWFVCNPRGFPSDCPNCGGLGYLWLRFVVGGPYRTPPPTVRPQTSTWIDNGWYIVESKTYPCPACTDPRLRIAYLWERSGLEQKERAWRVDFIEGEPGKEAALEEARALLAQIPKPMGFYVFSGDYGVGKSGLLRSLVAQSICAGVSAHYCNASGLLAEIRGTFQKDSRITEADVIATVGNYQVLAIDEIEKVSDSMWSISELMTILDTRYRRMDTQATLIGTNCNPDNMPQGFEPLQSRMTDGVRVPVGGRTLRGANETEEYWNR
jgi:DNA replication protein DnaC